MVKPGCAITIKSISPALTSIVPELLGMSVPFTATDSHSSTRATCGVDNTASILPWSRPKAWSTCVQSQVKCDLVLLKEEGV